jgi:hypothetical protein
MCNSFASVPRPYLGSNQTPSVHQVTLNTVTHRSTKAVALAGSHIPCVVRLVGVKHVYCHITI